MMEPLAAFFLDEDSRSLIEAVTAFAAAEIATRWPRPETAIRQDALEAIHHAALTQGLIGEQASGFGLWSEWPSQKPPAFTIAALTELAQHNTAVALHLHQTALLQALIAHAQQNPLDQPPPPTQWLEQATSTTALHPCGVHGWGRSAIARWCIDQYQANDTALLTDNYTSELQHRSFWIANLSDNVGLPVFDGSGFQIHLHHLADYNVKNTPSHGLDGLLASTLTSKQGNNQNVDSRQSTNGHTHWPISRSTWQQLMAAHLLGLTAIALGCTQRAAKLAHSYATLRVQGGRTIVLHDAVALLLSEIDLAIHSTTQQLTWLQISAQFPPLASAITIKHASLNALSKAANAAMQVHGGSGYMQDTGVECVLRDINCLRILGGTPDELAMILATLRNPDAAQPEPENTNGSLPGFVATTSPLAPLQAFKDSWILRQLAAYAPHPKKPLIEGELPPVLANYRAWLQEFTEREFRPHALQLDQALREPHASFPATDDPHRATISALISQAGRTGLLSDALPKPLGSTPLLRYRYSLPWLQAIRTENLSRVDGGLMLAISAHNLGLVPALFSGNTHVLRTVILPALRACERGEPELFAFAITEPTAGSDAEDGYGALHNKPGLVAHPSNGGWKLRGRKIFISGGDRARWIVAFAALAGEGFSSWTAFLVDANTPGFERVRNELKMGMRASGATELAFDDCFVPDAFVLGGLRQGWALNRATLNFSRLPVAGMAVGFAQNALEIATDYVCNTVLAGRPLITYQHTQLQLAEIQAIVTSIRAMVWQLAKAWTPWQGKASMAKFHVTDQAQRAIEIAMELCGPNSLLQPLGLEKTFRDNRLTRIFEGTNQINRLAVIEDQQSALLAKIAQQASRVSPT
ncbi:Predicted acyl-CoA dehydrogenase [gamma proteobacterium HdN1]|nr:Predicted acyl-CoA dehydrogenase [gamma proteobacterium HdN1]